MFMTAMGLLHMEDGKISMRWQVQKWFIKNAAII